MLTLGGLVAALLLGTFIAQVRLARGIGRRAADNEAVRVTAAVLSGEIRRSTPADLRAVSRDSIVLRAVRGLGITCTGSAGTRTVRFRGDRLPDARKDSALFLLPDSVAVLPVTDVRYANSAGCTALAGESVLELGFGEGEPAEVAAGAVIMLIFEPGRYYLTARALRYRLGAEGRQPLTAEAFRHPDTRFLERTPHALRFDLLAGGRRTRHASSFGPPPQ